MLLGQFVLARVHRYEVAYQSRQVVRPVAPTALRGDEPRIEHILAPRAKPVRIEHGVHDGLNDPEQDRPAQRVQGN